MNRSIAALIVLSSLLLAVSSAFAEETSTYDVHTTYALTGFAAPFGVAELNGSTLAIEEFNRTSDIDGKKVKLVVEDTQSTNAQTLNAVRKVISIDKAKIVLGPTWLDSYQAALQMADREKVLLFTPSAAVAVFCPLN
jgi:branched-chain amino acid transport system substrate-binding protein